MVFHCEIACDPTLPPASHLAFGESHTMAHFRIANGGLFVNEQGELIALSVLDKNGSPPNGDVCVLQKIFGKGTDNGSRSRHGSHPGVSGERSCHPMQPAV